MKSIMVNISEEEHEKLVREAKERLEWSFTDEKVKEFLSEDDLYIRRILTDYLDIYHRYENVKKKDIQKWNENDELIVALYCLIYNTYRY